MLYSPAFITMAVANLFNVSSFGTFFLFPIFIQDHGGSKSDIGIIMGIFALSSVLCRPWISDMIDRIGRKRSYTFGSIIMTVSPLIYLFFEGDLPQFYFFLILVRILHGIGLAVCFTAAFTYIVDIIPEKRLNEGIGMFGVTGLTGMAIGPVIGEIIIQQYDFSLLFIAAAGMAAFSFLVHIFLPESYVDTSAKFSPSFFSILCRRRMFNIALLTVLFGFTLSASGNFVAPFAKEHNIAFISLYYTVYSLAAILTRVWGGKIADRIGEERVIPYGIFLTGGGLFILIFLGGNMVLALSGLMSGCGHGLLFPSLNSLFVRNEPIEIRGKITGVFTGGIDGGAFIGSIILGYIGEWAGYPLLFFAAGLPLIAGLYIYRLKAVGG